MRVWTQANFDEEGEKRLRRNSFAKSQLSARPGTAPDPNKGMMTTSASLPRLPGAQRSPIVASPSATNSLAQISGSSAIVRNGSPRSPFPPGVDNPYEAESVALRRRNRELEHAVKSLKSQLNKRADLLKSYGEREKQAASSINVQYQQRLEQAEIEKIKALEQLRIELSGSAEEVAAKRAEQEKEGRVQLLCRQIGRRMMNRRLAHGWGAWHEMWSAKRNALNKLRDVANRLRAPEKAHAFGAWQVEWNEVYQQQLADEAAGATKGLAAQTRKAEQLALELNRVRDEHFVALTRLTNERDSLLNKLSALDDGMTAQLKAEKEAKIELLAKKSMRRMMNADLALGFEAWSEMYETHQRQMRLLQQAESRLMRPALTAAFGHWHTDWVDTQHASEEATFAQETNKLKLECHQLQTQLDEVKADYEARLAAAEAEISRQYKELTTTAEERAAAAAEKEKEERIELLRRQIGRRILNQGIIRGWQAWVECAEARSYAMSKLREVGMRLRSPEMSNAFGEWAEQWHEEYTFARMSKHEQEIATLKRERDATSADLRRVRAEAEEKIAALSAERAGLVEKLSGLTSGTEEAEALRLQKEALQKEQRVEHLRKQAMKRIMNKDLSLGFGAWLELWRAKRYALDRLREVANHLKAPELNNAFTEWAIQWEVEEAAAREAALLAEREAQFRDITDPLREEIAELRTRNAAMAEEHKTALDRLRTELTGSAAEQMALREEQEKEKRIQEMSKKAMRRMLQADLACGFDAWLDLYRVMSRLRQIAGKLKAPALANAFYAWEEDMDAEAREKADAAKAEALALAELQGKSLESQLRHWQHEHGQLKMLDVAQKDEIEHLRRKLSEANGVRREQEAEIGTLKPQMANMASEIEGLQKLLAEQKEATSAAEQRAVDAETETAQQRESNQAMLERLLADQQARFDEDLVDLRERAKEATIIAERDQKIIEELRAELAAALAKIEKLTPKAQPPAAAPAPAKPKAMIAGRPFELDPDRPVSEQLAEALKKGSARVLDLFRQWDTDGDGEVSKDEFHKAMPKLGFDVGHDVIEELFNEWDADGGGSLSFVELKKCLSAAGAKKKPAAATPKKKKTGE